MVHDRIGGGRHEVKRVLVIGDVIADVYRACVLKKMCPEDTSAMALVVSSREVLPGGAANVAMNLASLSTDIAIDLIGAMSDELAISIKRRSKNLIGMEYVVMDVPLTKERIFHNDRLVVRVDNTIMVSSYVAERIECMLRKYLAEHNPDLIVLSDYAGGSITMGSLSIILNHREKLIVDTKAVNLHETFGAGGKTLACKLNADEYANVLRGDHTPESSFKTFIVTKGSGGAQAFIHHDLGVGQSKTHSIEFCGHIVRKVDVNGCGDTFLAGFAAEMLRSGDPLTSIEFGNAAAATVVTKMRTAVASLEETLGMLGVGEDETSTGSARTDH